MKIGTKSVLFGAHCFFLHPWFVAAAWWKLYGFPFDPRLWFAFFLHDLGYLGKPNMDGHEGEKHVEFAAKVMSFLFDGGLQPRGVLTHVILGVYGPWIGKWGQLSFALTPRWLYLPCVNATGEINEYLKNAQKADSGHWKPTGYDKKLWHGQLCEYMTKWVEEHKDGAVDTWTDASRNARRSNA